MLATRLPIVAVWLAALLGTVVVVVAVPGETVFVALALVLSLAVVVALIVQVAVGQQRGFVVRLAVATTGALAAVALGAVVAAARMLG